MAVSSPSVTYDLLTTTRYDETLKAFHWNDDKDGSSPFFLLPRHLDRLLLAATRHGWTRARMALQYDTFKKICEDSAVGPSSRLRICVSQHGVISVSATPIPSLTYDPLGFYTTGSPPLPDQVFRMPTLNIVMDKLATKPSIYTSTKTTYRTLYDNARLRNDVSLLTNPKGAMSDVLLHNDNGLIMETTIYNIAFYRSTKWVTPSSDSGCLCGVLRSWLLENDHIKEDTESVLTKESIYKDEWVLLFNGLQGLRVGKIVSL